MAGEPVKLELPADPRFVDVALAAVETLAKHVGMDRDEIAELRDDLRGVLLERMQRGSGRVVLRYELGEGFLGLRVDDAPSGVTS
jgi:hypothetical protein